MHTSHGKDVRREWLDYGRLNGSVRDHQLILWAVVIADKQHRYCQPAIGTFDGPPVRKDKQQGRNRRTGDKSHTTQLALQEYAWHAACMAMHH